ncbi:zinc finger mym-type protein 2-like [Gigaspora margarita]|uniref:Zinc finger mym-type protein 2-like n=1 Tax=Gigaspora margarita TaxID=4874 RepID=A0A8H4EJ14_GIGMA|nr:zinc finger mym-type protein 2-like [Gigaspora margarita]
MPKIKKKEKAYQKPTEEQLSYLHIGLEGAPEDIDNTSKLETQLCEYFTMAKKSDKSEYTISSLLSAVRAINRFYNSNISKVKPVNLCNKKAFSATSRDTTSGLLNRVFFYNAIFLALYGGEHYTIMVNHFKKRKNGSFDVFIYKSKTNQRGLNNFGSADKILIPADNPEVIADYEKYFSKWPVDADPGFYLHPINTKSAPDYLSIKVWYKKTQLGQLKLKTFIKVLTVKTGISCEDRKITNQDGVQKSALSNLMNAIDSNVDKMISQNQPSTTLSTKDFYQGFKSARQIYQANFVSSMSFTSTTQKASVEASIIIPQLANLYEFQSSKILLQERPSVANQNHEMQELL